MASTTTNLVAAVERGTFRGDLYAYFMPLRLPPLRERREDVPEWFRLFVAEVAAGAIPAPTASVVESLILHDWPGNLHELKDAARSAVRAAGDEGVIQTHHLPKAITAKHR